MARGDAPHDADLVGEEDAERRLPWTRWNHVRTLASIIAFGLLTAAVVVEHQR